ncbi:HU family DNA-binding protein [Patescibacteria group bacterium]|nr:HU family DNA-binding protein [Patescibacteria group bacterium]
MTKRELIEVLAKKTKLTKRAAKEIVEAFLAEIGKALSRGEKVKLSGFGVFFTKLFKKKMVSPIGGGKKKSISSRRMPRFTPGTALKRAVR